MRILVSALLVCALFAHGARVSAQQAPIAADDPRPPSGIGALAMGAAGIGLGTINLATLPVCFASFYPAQAETPCVALSIAAGAALIAVGIPSLIVGKHRRERYRAWRERRRALQGLSLEGFELAPRAQGAAIALRARF